VAKLKTPVTRKQHKLDTRRWVSGIDFAEVEKRVAFYVDEATNLFEWSWPQDHFKGFGAVVKTKQIYDVYYDRHTNYVTYENGVALKIIET
jgi:hypothetical protein